jgi:predicted enzyme related to lactoylglutathione lyase
MTYLSSADAKATAAAAADAGGQVLLEPMDVMELGAMAVLADGTGGAVGVWQPGRHRGFEVHGEVGAPVWHELHTRDHAGAVAFYQRVFGWHTSVVSDTDEFRYTTMTEGEEQYAGIMDASGYLPEGTPPFWEVYFGVPDTDAALAAAERLGGKVLEPAVDTPYGRMAKVADPTGAVFKIVTVST